MDIEFGPSPPTTLHNGEGMYERVVGSKILSDDLEHDGSPDNNTRNDKEKMRQLDHLMHDHDLPVWVLHSSPTLPFFKSGLPDGFCADSDPSIMHAKNRGDFGLAEQAFRIGDQVMVGARRRGTGADRSDFDWVGPGEITSRGKTKTTKDVFTVFLEDGRNMKGIPASRLQRYKGEGNRPREVDSAASSYQVDRYDSKRRKKKHSSSSSSKRYSDEAPSSGEFRSREARVRPDPGYLEVSRGPPATPGNAGEAPFFSIHTATTVILKRI